MRAIDIHPHVISPDEKRYPRAPLGGKQSDWSRARPVDAGQMLRAMDEAGIEKSVLVQASTCYGHDNSYLADAVAANPDRFAGVFSVDMVAADARERIRYWSGRGLKGLRVFIAGHTTVHDARLDDPRALPAWRAAVDAGLPVCVQCRAPHLPQLEALLKEFPAARIILDHMARPTPGEPGVLVALARYPNLYLKLTTHNVRDRSFMPQVAAAFGAGRIAWGSNYPAAEGTLAGLLEEARTATANLSADEQDAIFSRTAKSLYPGL